MTASADAQRLAPLRVMQRRLQRLYGLPCPIDVAEFVTTDATWAQAMLGEPERAIGECVFVRSEDDTLDLSVYLDAELLGRLAAAEAGTRPAPDLNDLCMALEGVSHFLCIVTRAIGSRQTTPFELELQAEVDKFLVLSRLDLFDGTVPVDRIHHCLFEAMTLRPGMDEAPAQRYADANRYAGRYCRYLQANYRARASDGARFHDELYRFYRLPQPEKIRHIEHRGI
ncbi:MAG: hypothetical protein IT496_09085 [Gammaproteobacteria bacterium]|nr:hypothetical protein [Gammaproteobacteria bacterium]